MDSQKLVKQYTTKWCSATHIFFDISISFLIKVGCDTKKVDLRPKNIVMSFLVPGVKESAQEL